jgi:alkylation response protein AidB-like acyl-CoA dehydrogenase
MSAEAIEATSREILGDEHKAYRDSFRTFLSRRVVPAYSEWSRQGRIPREIFRVAGADGFLGMQVPEEHGGPGVDDPRFGIVAVQEAMLAGAPALALALIAHNDAVVPAVVRQASEDERARWLPRLASGEALGTVVLGELTIDRGPEGTTVDGGAAFVVQGVDAELLLVLTDDLAVLVERGAEGVTIEPSSPSIGLQAAGLADVQFEHARATPVGEDGGAARELLSDLALALAVSALAGARAALTITVAYVLERKAFGQPIASFQNTRHALAAASADIDAGQAFVDTCVRERLAGRLPDARAAALKLHCTELYGSVVDAGVQLHGGYGYIMEYPIAHAYTDARFWRLYGGTSEAMKEVIARDLLA